MGHLRVQTGSAAPGPQCRQEGWVSLCEVPTFKAVVLSLLTQGTHLCPGRAWAPPLCWPEAKVSEQDHTALRLSRRK